MHVFVWFHSLRPINNLSVIKGRVSLGWTSTKLGVMFLLKDTTQWRRWGSNTWPRGLELSALLCFQRCIVMRLFYLSYKQVKHDYSLLRAYEIICGRFNITVNWDYLHAQNQGKLARVCLHRFSSIFESTIPLSHCAPLYNACNSIGRSRCGVHVVDKTNFQYDGWDFKLCSRFRWWETKTYINVHIEIQF